MSATGSSFRLEVWLDLSLSCAFFSDIRTPQLDAIHIYEVVLYYSYDVVDCTSDWLSDIGALSTKPHVEQVRLVTSE